MGFQIHKRYEELLLITFKEELKLSGYVALININNNNHHNMYMSTHRFL